MSHAPDLDASGRRLWIALVMISYMAVEVIGGLLADSVALLADAGHMLADAGALGLALFALSMASRPASSRHTFGFQRTEVLAALLNALSLWLIAAWVFFEASRRFMDPPEVRGVVMLGVGSVGLVLNLAVAWVLHRSSRRSRPVKWCKSTSSC